MEERALRVVGGELPICLFSKWSKKASWLAEFIEDVTLGLGVREFDPHVGSRDYIKENLKNKSGMEIESRCSLLSISP